MGGGAREALSYNFEGYKLNQCEERRAIARRRGEPTKPGSDPTSRTSSDIDNKCAGDSRDVNPFSRQVLDLKTCMFGNLQELTVAQGFHWSNHRLGGTQAGKTTYKNQKPVVVMWANALVVFGVRGGDRGIPVELGAVQHVFARIVELVQRAGREAEGFGDKGDEGVREVLELGRVAFQDGAEAW